MSSRTNLLNQLKRAVMLSVVLQTKEMKATVTMKEMITMRIMTTVTTPKARKVDLLFGLMSENIPKHNEKNAKEIFRDWKNKRKNLRMI